MTFREMMAASRAKKIVRKSVNNETIKELHNKGMTANAIAIETGVSRTTILRRARRLGISFSKGSTWTSDIRLKDQLELVVELYLSGISTIKIGEQLGYHPVSVWKLLNANNIETPKRKYEADLTFFDVIDNEIKAYLLGFWYADGNVIKDRIRIALTDREIIDMVQEALQYTGPIYIKQPSIEGRLIQYEINITRTELADALIKHGCPPKKSLILTFPDSTIVPDHLIHHFARGYFDGDGNLYHYKKTGKWRVQIVGTREFLEGLSKASQITGYWSQRFPKRNNNCWTWTVGTLEDLEKFLAWIYQDANFYLTRKLLQYQECQRDKFGQRDRVPYGPRQNTN